MAITRVLSTNRICVEDGAAVDIVVVFPGDRESVTFSTDAAGVVHGCERIDFAMASILSITQSMPNELCIEFLDEEADNDAHSVDLAYLRNVFCEVQ